MKFRVLGPFIGLASFPAVSNAHFFGTSYTLPIPFSLYAYGAAATLIVTFCLLIAFQSATLSVASQLPSAPVCWQASSTASRTSLWIARWVSVGMLALILGTALLGSPDPSSNVGSSLFWVAISLGLTY